MKKQAEPVASSGDKDKALGTLSLSLIVYCSEILKNKKNPEPPMNDP